MPEHTDTVVEGTPLLTPLPEVNQKVATRRWRMNWYALFGDCSAQDVAAGMLAVKIPCVAWGWNQSRSMQFSFWHEVARFLIATFGVGFILHLACCLAMATLCPPPEGRHGDFHHGGHYHGPGPISHDDNVPHGQHGEQHRPAPIPKECFAHLAPAMIAIASAAIALFICIAMFFARRRTALRERFGIEGSPRADALVYMFCGPCAIAQETRTLMHEQVHEGVWYGPMHCDHATVPKVQAMNAYYAPLEELVTKVDKK